MKNKLQLIVVLILFYLPISSSQDFSIEKIEPPNWWVGMKWNNVQLMVYGDNLADVSVSIPNPEINISDVQSANYGKYLFVNIQIPDDINAGEYEIIFSNGEDEITKYYSILEREKNPVDHRGFSNEDVIYLIFADRFCDGNPENNTICDSLDEFTSTDLDGRHGGDIEGIILKLDYLDDLGVTALWITPLLENNMWMSYHGYAATDLYKIDPRFGSNELYRTLVDSAHDKGLKIILDHVSNHIGINHYWIKYPPFEDWFNGIVKNHIEAKHDKMAFLDIHGDSTVVKLTTDGWFQDYMPDLNQKNPFLKNYLIQNTIWWVEYSGLDGIREDTYPYSDQNYLSEWADAILTEYPEINIVGEIWKGVPSIISGYQNNSPVRKLGFESNLPAVTDFALADAVRWYLDGSKNIYQVYETLAQDIVYNDTENLLVFIDNHDIQRGMFIANGNVGKFKVALNLILFTRGIPVIFYGTEIGIEGGIKDGELRMPFPGGFKSDDRNAFTSTGRNQKESEIYNYLSELLKIRNENPVLSKGRLTQIYPGNDVLLLIKSLDDVTVLITINSGEQDLLPNPLNVSQYLPDAKTLKNLKTGKEISVAEFQNQPLTAYTVNIFLLSK